jgi:hypothetical protein
MSDETLFAKNTEDEKPRFPPFNLEMGKLGALDPMAIMITAVFYTGFFGGARCATPTRSLEDDVGGLLALDMYELVRGCPTDEAIATLAKLDDSFTDVGGGNALEKSLQTSIARAIRKAQEYVLTF